MKRALNQMTAPHLSFAEFVELAANLGCVGIEARNDMDSLGRPLFDGMDAGDAGEMVRTKGLRLLGLSQVYPFNSWDEQRRSEVENLISIAKKSGAETISLIPRNDGSGCANGERQANLRIALKEIYPMLKDADMVALVEPLGFTQSSLRKKTELLDTINTLNLGDRFKIVHDTFHHTLAHETEYFPDVTGIVHISGLSDPAPTTVQMTDAHRILVDRNDRLSNIAQIKDLIASGYDGAFSYECFSPETQNMANLETALAESFEYIEAQLNH